MKKSFLVSTFLSLAALSLSGYAKPSFLDSEEVRKPAVKAIKKTQTKVTKKRSRDLSSNGEIKKSPSKAKKLSIVANDLKKSPLIKKFTQTKEILTGHDQQSQKNQKISLKLKRKNSNRSLNFNSDSKDTRKTLKNNKDSKVSQPGSGAEYYYDQAEKIKSQNKNYDFDLGEYNDYEIEVSIPAHLSEKIQVLKTEAENLRTQIDKINDQIDDLRYPIIIQKTINPNNADDINNIIAKNGRNNRLQIKTSSNGTEILTTRSQSHKITPEINKKTNVLFMRKSELEKIVRKIEEKIFKIETDFYESARKKQESKNHPELQRYNELVAKGDERTIADFSKQYNFTPIQLNKNYSILSGIDMIRNMVPKNSLMSEQAHKELDKAFDNKQKIITLYKLAKKSKTILLSKSEYDSYKDPLEFNILQLKPDQWTNL